MSTGKASNFFVANGAIPDGEVPTVTRAVFDSPLKPGTDQLSATKAETALMNGRALDAIGAPGSRTRSKVNGAPAMSPTAPSPTLDDAVKRG